MELPNILFIVLWHKSLNYTVQVPLLILMSFPRNTSDVRITHLRLQTDSSVAPTLIVNTVTSVHPASLEILPDYTFFMLEY